MTNETTLGRILILDDEVELMNALRDGLRIQGYEAVGHSSAQEALKELKEREFDVLLSDLMMPEMDGIQVVQEALACDPDLVSIIMTGQGTIQTAVDAMKAGTFDYVLKPFKLRTVLPLIGRAVEVRRMKKENVQLRADVAIYELSQAIALTRDTDVILGKAIDAAMRQTKADEASIMLLSEDETELHVAVVRGEDREGLLGKRVLVDQGIAGWVAREQQPLVLDDPLEDSRFQPMSPRADLCSALAMPLMAGGKLTGVLNLNSTSDRVFTLGQVKALSILTSTAASALVEARLYGELRETNERLAAALTTLETAQTQVVQQERLRALGEMASGVAHDFNNTLTPILGFSELLLMDPGMMNDPENVRRLLETIHTSAEDAATVVNRLRDFYRPREQADVLGPVEVNQIVKQAITLTEPRWKGQAQKRGVTVRVMPELSRVPLVRGDESELREVLVNLIFNSVDAMPEGGTIILRTRQDSGDVLVEVEDTGAGMNEEVRQKCLEPFFTTKGDKGTGMGLAGAFGVIRRHGGSIRIRSAVGQGTAVTLRLASEASAEGRPQDAPESAPPDPLRILVVEDETIVSQVIEDYLDVDGHHVVTASNGREALELFRIESFDVVLTDRAMPGMNGDELAAALKRICPELPIIMVSGFGKMMVASGEKSEHVDAIVGKPVNRRDLREALAEVTKSAEVVLPV